MDTKKLIFQKTCDFAEYFNNRLYSDCSVISSCDRKFHAHKIILSRNEFFHKKLSADPMKISALNLDQPADILEELLYYLYTGKIKGTCKNIKNLLIAAKKYLFTDLEATMSKNLMQSLSTNNSIQCLLFAHHQELTDLENEIIDFIVK